MLTCKQSRSRAHVSKLRLHVNTSAHPACTRVHKECLTRPAVRHAYLQPRT